MARPAHIFAVTAAFLVSGPAWAAEQNVRLAVDNMTCAGCSYIVKKTLASVPGVTRVDVSLTKKSAVVSFDDAKTDAAALTQATASVGFPSRLVE